LRVGVRSERFPIIVNFWPQSVGALGGQSHVVVVLVVLMSHRFFIIEYFRVISAFDIYKVTLQVRFVTFETNTESLVNILNFVYVSEEYLAILVLTKDLKCSVLFNRR